MSTENNPMIPSIENTPFQQYGGKWEFAPWIAQRLPPGQTLVLVHGGSGSPLWHIEPGTYPVEVLNDLDHDVVNFFRVCRNNPEGLAALVALTPYSREQYESDHLASYGSPLSPDNPRVRIYPLAPTMEQARAWVTVARQSLGGAWGRAWSRVVAHSRRAMASGNSRWLHLPETILAVAARLSSVQIECKRDLDLIDDYDREQTVFYLDPPYHPETRVAGSYRHEYTAEQHQALLEKLLTIRGKAAISGYSHPLYEEKLSGWTRHSLSVHCRSNVNSAGGVSGRPRREEVLWVKE